MLSNLRAPHARTPAIREMQPADIPAVGALAERIWKKHYPDLISHAQIDYMLALMYAPDRLEEQLKQGHRFFLLEDGGTLTGFASIEQQEPRHWHIHKLYVDQEKARSGLGGILMRHILQVAKGARVTLHVNRQNYKAINFYFRHGFAIAGLKDSDIGNGFVMEDFVLARNA